MYLLEESPALRLAVLVQLLQVLLILPVLLHVGEALLAPFLKLPL